MSNNPTFKTLTLLTAFVTVLALQPVRAGLTVGDAAPKLQVGEWVQGQPVTEFDSNHVYIVEFWATWCGPCRTSIPHLNELHEKLQNRGLIVIGQDVWEDNEDGVAPFVKKMGKQMTYRVALDDKRDAKKGAMAEHWMAAANRTGIPTAFVVNKQGRIAWIGHPMGLNEGLLEKIIEDKFDVAAFAKEYQQEQNLEQQRRAVHAKLRKAMQEKDWDTAEAVVSELEKQLPEAMRYQLGITRLQILFARQDNDAAAKLADSLSNAHPNDAGFQNALAWTMITHKGLNKPDLLVAEAIAERANQSAKARNPAILDTLARAQFMLGKKEEAIATQRKAIDAAEPGSSGRYQKTLDAYRKGELPDGK